MPYSRKPIYLTTNSTVNEIREEINATITKLNELFNDSNELETRINPILNNPTILNGTASGTVVESGTFKNPSISDAVIENSIIGNTNTFNVTLDNRTGSNVTLTNSTLQNSSLNVVSITEASIQGYYAEEDKTYSVVSHTEGSTTVELSSLDIDLADTKFWYDGREYKVVSTDISTNTVTLEYVPSDVTFSGNLTFREGERSNIFDPMIREPMFSGVVHMDGDIMHMVIKHGTTSEREALSTGVANEIFFDTDLEQLYIYDGQTVGGIPLGIGLSVGDDRYLSKSENLADLDNFATARDNLSLGTSDTVEFQEVNATQVDTDRVVLSDNAYIEYNASANTIDMVVT